jgi:hypothetical protein
MGGDANSGEVAIYDHDQGCHISGSSTGLQYVLYHHGERRHISLTLEGSRFSGHDYGRSTRFRGWVGADSISIFEEETCKRFVYSLWVSLVPPWSNLADEKGIEPEQTDSGSQTA